MHTNTQSLVRVLKPLGLLSKWELFNKPIPQIVVVSYCAGTQQNKDIDR